MQAESDERAGAWLSWIGGHISRLDPEQARVLVQRCAMGADTEEVAVAAGVTPWQAGEIWRRARSALLASIERESGESLDGREFAVLEALLADS